MQNSNNIELDNLDLPVGINIIVINDKNEVLLGLRSKPGYVGDGTWGLIGGKLKSNETIEQAAKRELKEESNIECNIDDLKVINLASTITATHFLQIGVFLKKWSGIPQNMEPHKCKEVKFFPLDNLPENLFFGTKANIELFKEGKFYDKSKTCILD
jgi:ADP-ribose pyrophosphatase YjhB (NUDIX family)